MKEQKINNSTDIEYYKVLLNLQYENIKILLNNTIDINNIVFNDIINKKILNEKSFKNLKNLKKNEKYSKKLLQIIAEDFEYFTHYIDEDEDGDKDKFKNDDNEKNDNLNENLKLLNISSKNEKNNEYSILLQALNNICIEKNQMELDPTLFVEKLGSEELKVKYYDKHRLYFIEFLKNNMTKEEIDLFINRI